MNLNMYALHDRVAGFYGSPFFMPSDGEALRAVGDLARDLNTSVGRHPADYALYLLGVFDNVTGKLDACVPTHLANVINLLRPQPQLPGFGDAPTSEKETV